MEYQRIIVNYNQEFREKHGVPKGRNYFSYEIPINEEIKVELEEYANYYIYNTSLHYSVVTYIIRYASKFCLFLDKNGIDNIDEKVWEYAKMIYNSYVTRKATVYDYVSYFIKFLINKKVLGFDDSLIELADLRIYCDKHVTDSLYSGISFKISTRLNLDELNIIRKYFIYLVELGIPINPVKKRIRSAINYYEGTNSEKYKKEEKMFKEYLLIGHYKSGNYKRIIKKMHTNCAIKDKTKFWFEDDKEVFHCCNAAEEIKKAIKSFTYYEINNTSYKSRTIQNHITYISFFIETEMISKFEEISLELVERFIKKVEVSVFIKTKLLHSLELFFEYLFSKNHIKKMVSTEGIVIDGYKNNRTFKGQYFLRHQNKYKIINVSDYVNVNDSPRINRLKSKKHIHFEALEDPKNYDYLEEWAIIQCKSGYVGFNGLQKKINEIAAFFNAIKKELTAIKREDFLNYKNNLMESELKTETINSKISAICEFFTWCSAYDCIDHTIVYEKDLLKRVYQKKNNDLSIFELQLLFSHIKELDERMQIMISLMIETGMRFSEVISLEKDNFYEGDGNYYVEFFCTKGKKTNVNMISEKLYNIIMNYINNTAVEKELFRVKNYKMINNDDFNKALKDLCKKNNLKRQSGDELIITSHCFRHTASELLRKNGASAFAIQHILHHDSIDMTYKYINSSSDNISIKYSSLSDKAKANICESNILQPITSDVNLEKFIIEKLLYGTCIRRKGMKECKDSPNKCYLCKNFKFRIEYYDLYREQYSSICSLIDKYNESNMELPADLIATKSKLAEIIDSIIDFKKRGEAYSDISFRY